MANNLYHEPTSSSPIIFFLANQTLPTPAFSVFCNQPTTFETRQNPLISTLHNQHPSHGNSSPLNLTPWFHRTPPPFNNLVLTVTEATSSLFLPHFTTTSISPYQSKPKTSNQNKTHHQLPIHLFFFSITPQSPIDPFSSPLHLKFFTSQSLPKLIDQLTNLY